MTIATALIINPNGEMLILHRNNHVIDPNLWCLPGGVHTKNQDIKITLCEKVYNETGLNIENEELILISKLNRVKDNKTLVINVFSIYSPKNIKKIRINPAGHDRFMWVKPEDCKKMKDLIPTLYMVLEKLLEEKGKKY